MLTFPCRPSPHLPRSFYFPFHHCGSPSELYYSYDVAGAHVVMLGSYVGEWVKLGGSLCGGGSALAMSAQALAPQPCRLSRQGEVQLFCFLPLGRCCNRMAPSPGPGPLT